MSAVAESTSTYQVGVQSEPKRSSHVLEQTETLESVIEGLLAQASRLEHRLEPVLRGNYPQDSAKLAEADQELVPHAERLRGFVRDLRRLSNTLDDIDNRLEL